MSLAGQTSNPHLVRIDMARMINAVLGYGAVDPWEVDGLTDDWLYAFESVALRLPKIHKKMAEVESIKEQWRREYRQRVRH